MKQNARITYQTLKEWKSTLELEDTTGCMSTGAEWLRYVAQRCITYAEALERAADAEEARS